MSNAAHRLGFWARQLAAGLALTGCSSNAAQAPASGGAGAAGSGSGGAAGASSAGAGGTAPSYIVLSGDAALPGAASPTAYTACALCHGPVGQGVAALGPEIRHPPALYSTWVVRNGRANSGMLAFPTATLPDAQLSEIQSWLNALPKPTTGHELYVDYCGNCHGPTGEGGALSTGVTFKLKDALTMLVRTGQSPDPSMRFTYMPAETPTDLSDAELSLIATYLSAL